MSNSTPSKEEYRARIEKEDALLNTRTGIFLTINGLWVAAILINTNSDARLIVATVGTLVSFYWLECSTKSWKVISNLTEAYRGDYPDDRIEKIVQDALGKPDDWRRPTNILANILPVVSFSAWLIGLIFLFLLRVLSYIDSAK
jgi:hypothetical protein